MAPVSLRSSVTILLALSPLVAGNCENFTVTKDYYSSFDNRQSQAISKGVNCEAPSSDYTFPHQQRCNSTNECPTATYGVVNAFGTNNLSLTKDQVLPIYNLVHATTSYKPPTFLYSLSSTLVNISSCIKVNGTNGTDFGPSEGHWIFTPDLFCIEGILSQCTNGPVNDGTAIQLCAVGTYGGAGEYAQVDGTTSFLVTDYESAASLAANPAAKVSPVAREPASTSTSSPSASARLVVPIGLLSRLIMGILFLL